MSITDKLREWARDNLTQSAALCIHAIADRIDAEHETACAEAYGNGVMSVPIALDESVWVELPKDADDVPWSVGDRDEDGNVVTQLRLSSDGWYAITDGLSAFHPEQRRHHHEPTVEDVLREFYVYAERGKEHHREDVDDAVLADYAAKLRLAGSDAE